MVSKKLPHILIEENSSPYDEISEAISVSVLVKRIDAPPAFSNGRYQVDIEGIDYPLLERKINAVNFFGSEAKADRDELISKIIVDSVWNITGEYFIDCEENEIRVFPEKYVQVFPLIEDYV